MVKETVTVTKTCSQCGHNGHNSRTCLNVVNKVGGGGGGGGGVKLFGVTISSDPVRSPEVTTALRKSLSLGNLESLLAADDDGNNPIAAVEDDSGYHSDGQIHSRKGKVSHEKKKGKPWTEEEHRVFLIGLKKLGKGDWKGIAKSYVTTRTPTQVASHAQKYFIRLNSNDKKKRRASLFDLSLEDQKGRQSQLIDASASSSSKSPSKQPITGTQEPEPVQGGHQSQAEISNRFQNLSMEYMPIYQPVPPYYNYSPFMFHPMYYNYANPEAVPVRFIHPSGIPVPRHVPMGLPQSQANGASNMTKKDGLDLDIGVPSPPLPPPPPQATGGSDLAAHGVIHVN